jgi:flagellin-like protein
MIMNFKGISPIVDVLMLIVFIVITAGVLTNPAILSKLKGETPPNTILDVSTIYYSNTNELKLTLTHKGGDPLDLRKVKITVASKEGSEKLDLKFGSGLISLKGYYYRLDTSTTNPNSHNPDDIVFSELVFTRDEESINYHWGRDGPS